MRDASLTRRTSAELVGSALLVLAVVGSGIAAQRLSTDVGVQLLENTLATVFALVAILLALGPVSGAHLNPIVTVVEALAGRLARRDVGPYVVAQILGAVTGAILANALHARPLLELATTDRSAVRLVVSEAVATFGLLIVIRGVASSAPKAVPLAVAAWVGGAYWFTSSTAFANPAVTVARALSDSFAGIAPASVPGFLAGQVAGGALYVAAGARLFRDPPPS